jgi:hypothetical protein
MSDHAQRQKISLKQALHEASVYGIGATSDANQRVILEAAKALAAQAADEPKQEERSWRCFYCNEVFATKESAREHFRKYGDDPACLTDRETEKCLIQKIIKAQTERDEARSELAALRQSADVTAPKRNCDCDPPNRDCWRFPGCRELVSQSPAVSDNTEDKT